MSMKLFCITIFAFSIIILLLFGSGCKKESGTEPSIDTNSKSVISKDMITITGGTFTMGSSNSLDVAANPPHFVTLSDYSMSATEIRWGTWDTVYQWCKRNGYSDLPPGNKGYLNGDDTYPVTGVSWWDVVRWCNALSEMERLTPAYHTSTSFTDSSVFRTGNIDILSTMAIIYLLKQNGNTRHAVEIKAKTTHTVEATTWTAWDGIRQTPASIHIQ
jgi:hypothetical protein